MGHKLTICLCLLAIVILGLSPAGLLSADVKNYKGRIFDIGDLNKDGKKEVVYRVGDTIGFGIFKEGSISLLSPLLIGDTAGIINDMRIGDVDNDGDNEIVAIGKDDLYVWEREKGRFLLDSAKTTPIYGDKRIGKPEILNTAEKETKALAEWSRKWLEEYGGLGRYPEEGHYFELPASYREGKRIAIGDFTNNGKSEIIITKSSRLVEERGKCMHRKKYFYHIVDFLSWKGDHFEVINSLPNMGGAGDGGLAIFDINEDGKNELIDVVWDGYFLYQYDPKYFSGPPLMIKEIKFMGDGDVGHGREKIAAGIVGTTFHCLVGCAFVTRQNWSQEDVGQLKVFRAPIKGWLTREALEERLMASINLPTESFDKDNEREIANIESILVGDIDNDGENEIMVNYKKGFFYIIAITNGALVFE